MAVIISEILTNIFSVAGITFFVGIIVPGIRNIYDFLHATSIERSVLSSKKIFAMDASSFMLFILFFSSLGGVISAFLINEKLRVFLIVLLIIVVGVMIFFEIFFLNKISPRKHPVLVIDSDKNKYIILGKTIDGYVLVGTFQTGDGESDSSELEQKFISTEEIMNYTFKELKQQDDETSAPNNNDQNK